MAKRLLAIVKPYRLRAFLSLLCLLLPTADDRAVYIEFAAYYLELRRFAPVLLAHTFPGLCDRSSVDTMLADEVDDDAIFAATRPEGAPELRLVEMGGAEEGLVLPDRLALVVEHGPTRPCPAW